MRILILVICLIITSACNLNSLKKDIKQMLGKKILIPTSLQRIAPTENNTYLAINIDTICNNKSKLIVYIDSVSCMSCAVSKMHHWDKYIKKVECFSNKFQVVFIFSPMKSEYTNLYSLLQIEQFNFPVWVDSTNVFSRINSFIPNNPICHTFLTDKNNKILLVGNPLKNDIIENKVLDYLKSW